MRVFTNFLGPVFLGLLAAAWMLSASCGNDYDIDGTDQGPASEDDSAENPTDDTNVDDDADDDIVPNDEFHIIVFDVGLGESALVTIPDGDGAKRMLIDGGSVGDGQYTICPILHDEGAETIDVMAVSHPDYDHCGGLSEIFDCATVLEVWENGDSNPADEGYQVFSAARDAWGGTVNYPELGSIHSFGEGTVAVLNTMRPEFTDYNDNSMALRVDFQEFSLILTADIEQPAQQLLADTIAEKLACDVIEVPSHGAWPFSQDFIDSLHALFGIVSVDSTVDPSEYPDQRTITAYELAVEGAVYLTEDTGHMTITLSDQGQVVLTTER